jgi:serine/threonine-protein kinase
LPIADALASAHAQGVVHLDLKPDNVFITQTASLIQPKVVDFGFAKHGLSDGSPRGHEQAVAGGLRYMAPEQVLGQNEVDHRVDVWAFCAVLYECVAGQPPFDGAHYETLLFRILDGAPAPITELSTADAALARIVARGLSKQPERRWPSMRELGKALAAWLCRHGVTEDVSGNSLRGAWLGDPPSLAIAPLRALGAAPVVVRRLVPSWRAIAGLAAALAAASTGVAWLARAGVADTTLLKLDGPLGRVAGAASAKLREEVRKRAEAKSAEGAASPIRASVEGSDPRTSAARPTLPLQGRAGRP